MDAVGTAGVDSMQQEPSADGRAAWQRQNGASVQPADLLDFCFVISSCRLLSGEQFFFLLLG